MMQASQHRMTDYPLVTAPDAVDILFNWHWNTLVKPLMKTGMIEKDDIQLDDTDAT